MEIYKLILSWATAASHSMTLTRTSINIIKDYYLHLKIDVDLTIITDLYKSESSCITLAYFSDFNKAELELRILNNICKSKKHTYIGILIKMKEDLVESDEINLIKEYEPSDEFIVSRWQLIKKRAKENKVKFNLSLNFLRKLLKQKYCHYTGIKMNNIHGHDNQRTIDQFLPGEGYTDYNTIACCRFINQKKGNLLPNEIEWLYKGVQKFKKRKNNKL